MADIKYVDFQSGSDSNSGNSPSAAKKTVRAAAESLLIGNDVVGLIQVIEGGLSREQGIPWSAGFNLCGLGTDDGGFLPRLGLADNAVEDLFVPTQDMDSMDFAHDFCIKNIRLRGGRDNNRIVIYDMDQGAKTVTLANPSASTTLSAAIADTVSLSFTVADGTVFPKYTPFDVVINTECFETCTRSGNTITATSRGGKGTTAATHSSGDTARLSWSGDVNLQPNYALSGSPSVTATARLVIVSTDDGNADGEGDNNGLYTIASAPTLDSNQRTVLTLEESFPVAPVAISTNNYGYAAFRDILPVRKGGFNFVLDNVRLSKAPRFGLHVYLGALNVRCHAVSAGGCLGAAAYFDLQAQQAVTMCSWTEGQFDVCGDAAILVRDTSSGGNTDAQGRVFSFRDIKMESQEPTESGWSLQDVVRSNHLLKYESKGADRRTMFRIDGAVGSNFYTTASTTAILKEEGTGLAGIWVLSAIAGSRRDHNACWESDISSTDSTADEVAISATTHRLLPHKVYQ